MSSPLAIAAVTAVLQKFLQNSVAKYGLDGILNGTVKVSAEPPDRIDNGAASPDRINSSFSRRPKIKAGATTSCRRARLMATALPTRRSHSI